MKRLLLVSYYFPPMGGVPVRRVLRMVRHLPEHGWSCTVLTADRPYDPFHPEDPEGLENLPPCDAVLRAPARSFAERAMAAAWRGIGRLRPAPAASAAPDSGAAAPGGGLRSRLYETLQFPDPKRAWQAGAVALGRKALAEADFDAVLASGYPWTTFLVGDALAREAGLPLVLDYRDAWTLNPRGLWSGDRHRRCEAELIARSAAVVVATDWIRDHTRERYPEHAARIETLTNGYDVDRPPPDPALEDPERLVATFTGSFNDAHPPSDLDQSPYYLIEAAASLPDPVRRQLRIRLVGRVGDVHARFAEERGIGDVVEIEGPVSHRRALQHQGAADVLLVLVCRGQGRAGVLTGKVLEYVGARRPVLALAPEGELAGFVRARELGWVEPPDDPAAIARRLTSLVEAKRAGELPRETPPHADLSASGRAARLAEILDGFSLEGVV